MSALTEHIYTEGKVTDLLVRYWGLGKKLEPEEKEVLLAVLDEENKFLGAPTHKRAIERLREMGIR